ncbi:TPA: class I SAM-dependent methyltransferase [Candidatus Woesearchaeota archaeon]|nr:class I SAM-dependent methyltransferase [Candidatus Woesearchaeota archaeon]HIH31557.1 class I SAM-dependent methyltransferase [Candidatus Woesearchaeota archaeon]HIH54285.1 class I SAM-dependent methyltransferase [Candidatus Woesearchaeota archaeon]HIJ02525.1 class I SAM-dependent methyltransferase [Candidatus Woesearchaeota archaeon]HIJ13429.1 class I SAM-dependent methyltransferase [Candidatus Woesearchaeota archaeon]
MKNYNRYKKIEINDYEKKRVTSFFCRLPSDKRIMPLISKFKKKDVLEIGVGTGHYTKVFLENKCRVKGVDINPHLGRNLNIPIVKARADDFSKKINNERFDIVASFWITEYLNPKELEMFFNESRIIAKNQGMFISTFISKKGLGNLYIKFAWLLRGIKKYNYKQEYVTNILKQSGFSKITIIDLNSRFNIPWAYLVIAK